MNRWRVLSASTKYPNTPETDLQKHVLHEVEVLSPSGIKETREVMAQDPLDALNIVDRQLNHRLEEL